MKSITERRAAWLRRKLPGYSQEQLENALSDLERREKIGPVEQVEAFECFIGVLGGRPMSLDEVTDRMRNTISNDFESLRDTGYRPYKRVIVSWISNVTHLLKEAKERTPA